MAELGDKTQLATVLFAAQAKTPLWGIFAAASLALVCAAAFGVLAGSVLHQYVNVKVLTIVAGAGFIGIGLWTLVAALRN